MKHWWPPLVGFFVGVGVAMVGVWMVFVFSDVEHVSVPIYGASELNDTGWVVLSPGSCNGTPHATVTLGAEYFEVEVKAFLPKRDQEACRDAVAVRLASGFAGEQPPTSLLDVKTGEVIEISRGG